MKQRTSIKTWLMAIVTISLISLSAFAQREERGMSCNDGWRDGDNRKTHCEMREQTIGASGKISVDARQNGGIAIKGWERKDILVRAKVQATAPTEDEAASIAKLVQVETAGAQIRADGPQSSRDRYWVVSYEVFVPRQSDLSLQTHNGGISVSSVRGNIEFEAVNGGVVLREVAGSVKGETTNGGLSINLSGNRWDGEGLDVKTTNGGINLSLPDNYSARLETSTVNGGLNIGFPVTVQGKIEKELSVDLGSGGPTLRVRTTNGGVSIKRRT